MGVRADLIAPCPPTDGAAVLMIETDSISLIGPTVNLILQRKVAIPFMTTAADANYLSMQRWFLLDVRFVSHPPDLVALDKLGDL